MAGASSSPTRRAGIGLMLSVLLCCFQVAAAAAAERSADPVRCDLTVLVAAHPSEAGPSSASALVALSYAHLVDHQRLRAAIADLAARTRAKPSDVLIEDSPLERTTSSSQGLATLATAAQFQASGLVRPQSGVLPVGGIIRSLPDWRRMRLIFLVGDEFPFRGPHQAAADGFVLRLVNQVAAYEYDVERMSGRISPPEEPSPTGPPAEPLVPAALIGLVTGLAAGWLLGGPLRGGAGR